MIHAAVGSRAGVGARLTKRSGIVAYAVSSTSARGRPSGLREAEVHVVWRVQAESRVNNPGFSGGSVS